MINYNSTLNAMTSCTDKLSELTAVLIKSLSVNNPDCLINFYLFHVDICEKKLQMLSDFCKTLPNVCFSNVLIADDIELWGQLVVKKSYSAADIARYLWLEAHRYLPSDMDRILYLDAFDTLVIGDIQDFYATDFEDKLILSAIEINRYYRLPILNIDPAMEYYQKTKDLETVKRVSFGLINSGSIVLNLNKFRKEGLTLSDYVRVFKWTQNLGEHVFGDQGLFSLAYGSNHRIVSNDYNYRWFSNDTRRDTCVILHYTGSVDKPFKYYYEKEDELRICSYLAESGNEYVSTRGVCRISPWYPYYNQLWWNYCKDTPVWDEYHTKACENTKSVIDKIDMPTDSSAIKEGVYCISNANGQSLTVAGSPTVNGTRITATQSQSSNQYQHFRLCRNSDNTYTIFSASSSKSVEVRNSSSTNGASVSLWSDSNKFPCKRWYIVETGENNYKFVNSNSGKVLDIGKELNSAVCQWSWENSSSQKFKLEEVNSIDDDSVKSIEIELNLGGLRMVRTDSLLRNLAIIGAMGGSVFDYYLDKGITKINLYAEKKYFSELGAVYEQALWLNVEIENCFSSEDAQLEVHYLAERSQTLTINKMTSENLGRAISPFITIGFYGKELKESNHEKISFTECYTYSSIKRSLFEKVLNYKYAYAPKLQISVLTYPLSKYIKNPDEHELSRKAGPSRKEIDSFNEMFGANFTREEIVAYNAVKLYRPIERLNTYFVKDYSSANINIINGYRHTTNQPENAKKRILLFGFSSLMGHTNSDEFTIPSVLQKQLISHFGDQCDYKVINCANGSFPNYNRQYTSFLHHQLTNDDIAIFVLHEIDRRLVQIYSDRITFVEPNREVGLFNRPHNHGKIFSDSIFHLTNKGCELLGEYLAKRMIELDVFTPKEYKGELVKVKRDFTSGLRVEKEPVSGALKEYIDGVRTVAPRIGSIVMNCNPFTLGHRYLIEESAKKVSQLIIFVVEEDKSVFPFKDRIELVRKGTADLKNVTVVPSGGFIISQQTFGAYFEKDSQSEVQIDPSNDVEIFAKDIAPSLGITIRFAGEEPLDFITRQYNETMARILPRYGVDFEVIPRKESGNEVISASRVRKLLKEGDFESIAKLVPSTTLEYLRAMKE